MRTILFFLGMIIIIGTGIAIKSWTAGCPTSVSPKDLVDMIYKDENYKAEILKEKKFISKIDSINWNRSSDGSRIIVYRYQKGELDIGGKLFERHVTEEVCSSPDGNNWLLYDFADKRKYADFLHYLAKMGGSELNNNGTYDIDDQYKPYKQIKFENCIFIEFGFMKGLERYMIPIVKYKKITPPH